MSTLATALVVDPQVGDALLFDGNRFVNGPVTGALDDLLTTKGDIIVRGATTVERHPVGSDGQILTADSAAARGVSWADPAPLLSAKADLLTHNGVNQTILPVGSDFTFLQALPSTGIPQGMAWSTIGQAIPVFSISVDGVIIAVDTNGTITNWNISSGSFEDFDNTAAAGGTLARAAGTFTSPLGESTYVVACGINWYGTSTDGVRGIEIVIDGNVVSGATNNVVAGGLDTQMQICQMFKVGSAKVFTLRERFLGSTTGNATFNANWSMWRFG